MLPTVLTGQCSPLIIGMENSGSTYDKQHLVKTKSNSLFSNFSRYCILFSPKNNHPSLLQPDSKQHNEGGVPLSIIFPMSP